MPASGATSYNKNIIIAGTSLPGRFLIARDWISKIIVALKSTMGEILRYFSNVDSKKTGLKLLPSFPGIKKAVHF